MLATKSVLKALLGEVSYGPLPQELVPVDRIMQRYWVANGNGVQVPVWDDNPRYSRPPPLDDDTATVVDRIVLKLPPRNHLVVKAWYGSPLPTRVIAEEIGMTKRTFEQAHCLTLNFLRWKFECSKSQTLLKLLIFRV
jgi:hypothetical protein